MLQAFSSTIIGTLSFLLVLGLVVFIHELGHYSVARFFKVAVERFSIGFGKPIVKWTAKSGTEWSIGRIPLGGYVKFFGDAGAASNPDTEHLEQIKRSMDTEHGKDVWKTCLHFKPLYQRVLVVAAGPFANFVLAVFLYAGLALVLGNDVLAARVSSVTPGSVAQKAGFTVGDKFVSINGKEATMFRHVVQAISLSSDTPLNVVVERDARLVELTVTPVRTVQKDAVGGTFAAGQIGVGFSRSEVVHERYTLAQAGGIGVSNVYNSLASTGVYIKRIFQGKEDGKALGSIGKIAVITGKMGADAAKVEGSLGDKFRVWASRLLGLAAGLSVALGFANLMPIPVLDGGHLMYYGYEAIMRRPLSERVQEIGFKLGFATLITLFLVLTWNDIGYVADMFGNKG
ncbi:MAG: RIP metalloprotease RseP [Robiginitomaculum sp.]|nr:MAG: RIP metalloprotease RseP [Robiginitomaculum sp.]